MPAALRAVGRGGVVVCAGIHMSDIPSFPYEILWGERVLRSVANLTRADAIEFLDLAPRVPVRTHVTTFALEEAEAALDAVRARRDRGRRGDRPLASRHERPRVELLFWDGCPSHPQALDELRAAMAELGLDPDRSSCARSTPTRRAGRERFVGSPTIRVDGADVLDPATSRSA